MSKTYHATSISPREFEMRPDGSFMLPKNFVGHPVADLEIPDDMEHTWMNAVHLWAKFAKDFDFELEQNDDFPHNGGVTILDDPANDRTLVFHGHSMTYPVVIEPMADFRMWSGGQMSLC